MSEEQGSFKVTDRRLFNADGTPRELTPEEIQESLKNKAVATEPQPTSSIAHTPTAPESHPEAASAEPKENDYTSDSSDPASFVNFLMSIASNAASALGMMEHPVTHQREVDLELAKHWIDVLGMLQQKTRGNLTAQEKQILEGLLSDLRMQYVSFAETPTSKGARPYTGRDIIGGK